MGKKKEKDPMRTTAARIIRGRKQRGTLNDELLPFRQIDRLLSEEDGQQPATSSSKPAAVVELNDSEIPAFAPGYDILNLSRVNWIFTKSSFHFFIASVFKGHTFDQILQSQLLELAQGEIEKPIAAVYLMACDPNKRNVTICRGFLAKFPVDVTMSDIQLLLCNFGAAEEFFTVPLPDFIPAGGNPNPGSSEFPFHNLNMLLDYLCVCVHRNGVLFDAGTEGALKFLVKFSLDKTIRGAPVFALVLRFLSLLTEKCVEKFGAETVAEWLASVDYPMNKLEVCRFLRTDKDFAVRLFEKTMKKLVSDDNLKLTETRDIVAVVRLCKENVIEKPLAVYVVLQLLIALLPYFVVRKRDATLCGQIIQAVEERVTKVRHAADAMRLKAVCSQLRGLVLISIGLEKL